MFEPTFAQRLQKRAIKLMGPIQRPFRRSKLDSTDFTIISNNCWGGIVYEWYGLQKKSPTVGLWFFADDYLKFISNLPYYLSLDMRMIPSENSRRYDRLVAYRSQNSPIGLLDDIEVVMLHYSDPAVAKAKWERRCARVNYDNMIVKFSCQNDCRPEMLRQFDEMTFEGFSPKKIMFINRPDTTLKCSVYYPGFEDESFVGNDTYFFNRYFDLTRFINEGVICQRNNGCGIANNA